jgi:acetyl esterase/lipase
VIDRRGFVAAAVASAGALVLGSCGTGPGDARPIPSTGDDGTVREVREVRYGADPSQFAELSIPLGTDGPPPVAVVIHGGFWRSAYDLSLGRPLAATLPPRGWAALNVEYRRVGGGGGFAATLADVAAAIDALAAVVEPLDLTRVVTIGHSAGGQLAAWAATRVDAAVAVTAVVAQAGVLDLRRAAADRLGNGATQAFLGGEPSDVPERYDVASPIEQLPLGVPVLCIHGRGDANVPLSQSEAFVAVATASGDDAELITVDGDHFVLIDPASGAWSTVLDWLDGS